MSFKYLRKPHVREKSGPQDMGQNPKVGGAVELQQATFLYLMVKVMLLNFI